MAYQKLIDNFVLSKEIQDYIVYNIHSSKIFIYIVNFSNYSQDLKLLWDCLSVQEKTIAKTYRTGVLFKKYIISHGVLRRILSYYTNYLPQNIEFLYQNNGKPYLNENLQFNMSHSYDLVGYAISPSYKIGIDIEWHDTTLDICTIADLVFTPYEDLVSQQLKYRNKIEFFYDLWTIKESLVKASGQGLSYPINTIEIAKSSSNNKIYLNNEVSQLAQELFYYHLNIANNYSAAISVEHKINQIVYLEMNNQNNIFDHIRLEWIY